MEEQFERTGLLIGKEGLERLASARVAVFGIGGVGGYTVEALARSGIGALDLIDNDTVAPSNLNRQIIALHSTIGLYKTDVAAARAADINPDCRVRTYHTFFLPETSDQFDFTQYDYVVDAIDTVTGKLMLIEKAKQSGTPVISSMGAGNKLDPAAFEVADIYQTSVCPLAKVIRRECRKRGISDLKVVYSKEVPLTPLSPASPEAEAELSEKADIPSAPGRRSTPGSVAFVPSVAGLIIAGEVVRDLLGVARAD